MSRDGLYKAIASFVKLQRHLAMALRNEFPEAINQRFAIGFPKHGTVTVGGQNWEFIKHGVGFLFKSEDSKVVDLHNFIDKPSYFDKWRLQQYFESINFEHPNFDLEITGLVDSGEIEVVDKIHELMKLRYLST